MIDVDIMGPHPSLETNCARVPASRFYMPWKPVEEVTTWLVQHVRDRYIVTPIVEMSFEQGVGALPMFTGIKFIFEDHDSAMLFKLTWL